jgi:GTP-binding protein
MFIDQAKIHVKAGHGGPGCVSFHREKFIAKGGPDGGDGGYGGSIYFEASADIDTLIDFSGKHNWEAKNGLPGEGGSCKGCDGEDLIIKVPLGTLVYDEDFDILLKDMTEAGVRVRICKGGKFGKGNRVFATSVNQTPRFAQPGKPGQERNLRLELKLIADVGLVGLPNAGKSTLISRCSAAKPKIANYPFTTLQPVLGIVDLNEFRRFVMADIPGLIEGASEGAGLGHDFLKHIERTRIIVHLLEVAPVDESDPVENYYKIRKELEKYSSELAQKQELIVANKIDLDNTGQIALDIQKRIGKEVFAVSAVSGQNIKPLTEKLWGIIKAAKDAEVEKEEEKVPDTY